MPVYRITAMFDHDKCTAVQRGFLCYQGRRHKHHTPALGLPVSGGFVVTHSHRACTTHAQAENEGRGTAEKTKQTKKTEKKQKQTNKKKVAIVFGRFSNSSFLNSSESQTSSGTKP